MAVDQLGRIAHRVGGDGALALDVQLPGGFRGQHHLKVQLGEEARTRRAGFRTCSARRGCRSCPGCRCPSPCPPWRGAFHTCTASGQAGAVSPCPEGLEQRLPEMNRRPPSKVLTVRAQWLVQPIAGDGLGSVLESASAPLPSGWRSVPAPDSRAARAAPKAPMMPGDGGTDDIPAQLLLKGAEHRVVVEGAALNHDVLPQVVGGSRTDAPCRWRF